MATRKRASTSDDEPASKRQRNVSPEEPQSSMADAVIDVYADGDAILVVKGIAGGDQPIRIRVSSHALSIGSSVFKRLLEAAPLSSDSSKTLELLDDDGDALFLLCNCLHLRNNALPSRILPFALISFVRTAVKYDAVIAVSRAATPWLDQIYNSKRFATSDADHIFHMLEASYLLDDPNYFARFSSRWVLQEKLGQSVKKVANGFAGRTRLATELIARQKEAINSLKVDLELVVDACAEALSEEARHFVNCPPGAPPLPDMYIEQKEPDPCSVDKDGAIEFLSALRDADLWPATRWPNTARAIVKMVEEFRIPEHDSSEGCSGCFQVEDQFVQAIELVRSMHKDRLWGMCLDCYKNGAPFEGDCRYEHVKPVALGDSVRSSD